MTVRQQDRATDVLICGAGMGGLCAAIEALQQGARVTVLEKGPQPGGSMRISGATVWTGASIEAMQRWVPEGDAQRMRVLVDNIQADIAWLGEAGVSYSLIGPTADLQGAAMNAQQMTDAMVSHIRAAGGQIICNTSLKSLVVDAAGSVTAVVARRGEERLEFQTGAVVLATGGFQANRDLVSRYITPHLDPLLLRTNLFSTGDGLLAALDVGARTSSDLSSFYGHTMPVSPANPTSDQWTHLTQYHSQHCILVNERGERFFDESLSMADEKAPQAIARQPGGRAFLILDQSLYSMWFSLVNPASGYAVGDKVDAARQMGQAVVTGRTLPELADRMAESSGVWGVNREGFLATMDGYNRAVAAGQADALPVRRTRHVRALDTPPYYAMAVRAGITFTLGGIDTDTACRVLHQKGVPIRGLYAAGADVGGVYHNGYMGGLAVGLVQGRIAGREAAVLARHRD